MAVSRKKTSRASKSSKTSNKVQARRKTVESRTVQEPSHARWTFLTNHSHVLILLSRNPNMVLRQVAIEVGITERAVQRIIADLEESEVIRKEKVGRQNHYFILGEQPLRHPVEAHRSINDLLELLADDKGSGDTTR